MKQIEASAIISILCQPPQAKTSSVCQQARLCLNAERGPEDAALPRTIFARAHNDEALLELKVARRRLQVCLDIHLEATPPPPTTTFYQQIAITNTETASPRAYRQPRGWANGRSASQASNAKRFPLTKKTHVLERLVLHELYVSTSYDVLCVASVCILHGEQSDHKMLTDRDNHDESIHSIAAYQHHRQRRHLSASHADIVSGLHDTPD